MRAIVISIVLLAGFAARGNEPSKLTVAPNVETKRMGGVDIPSPLELQKMHASQYVLRAAQGKLTRVPVSRVQLPHSNGMNPQAVQVDLSAMIPESLILDT